MPPMKHYEPGLPAPMMPKDQEFHRTKIGGNSMPP
jgi:hypothetical protein